MSAPSGHAHAVPPAPAVPAVPAVPAPTVNETVYTALARWALRASYGRLTAWTVGGAVDAVGIVLVVPSFWPLALPFACLASIGAWGLASRRVRALELAGLGGTARWKLLRAVRPVAVVIGTVAAVAAFYTALWLVLGPSWTL